MIAWTHTLLNSSFEVSLLVVARYCFLVLVIDDEAHNLPLLVPKPYCNIGRATVSLKVVILTNVCILFELN